MKAKLIQSLVKQITVLLKVLIIAIILIMLYFKLIDQQDLLQEMKALFIKGFTENRWLLLLVILLMPVNWFIEGLKWKIIAGKIVHLSKWQAFKGILSGLTIGFATPHGIGDYLGRIMTIKHRQRFFLIGGIMLGRLSQLGVTLLFGMVGVFYLFGLKTVVYCSIAVLVTSILLAVLFNRVKHIKSVGRFFRMVDDYSVGEVGKIILLSACRYFVFSLQFLIVLFAFLPKFYFALNAAGVTWVFLAKSILPSFNFLSDLGIREYSAIYFFENYQIEILPVLCASLFIWMVNILMPTLLGIPFVFQLNSKVEP